MDVGLGQNPFGDASLPLWQLAAAPTFTGTQPVRWPEHTVAAPQSVQSRSFLRGGNALAPLRMKLITVLGRARKGCDQVVGSGLSIVGGRRRKPGRC